jgi:putative mRNA 3-end processing factor
LDLVIAAPEGLYCTAGNFYIDPWRPVERAVITHAHADHARSGHGHYLAAACGAGVLRARLGDIDLQAMAYGEPVWVNGVRISLHPAGHVLGSAQVRLEHGGTVWVASGDYKTEPDATCAPFEPVACDTFITESTFGLPIYRWQAPGAVFDEINAWWAANAGEQRASVLFCYAFGKAQRILSALDPGIGPIICHGALEPLNLAYREAGVALPDTRRVTDFTGKREFGAALVLAPPSAAGSPWLKRFGDYSDAFASGWMRLRGARRRRSLDRGFILSDHADWPGLLGAIGASGAQRVIVTHGQIAPMVRWLCEQGLDAGAFTTEYGDDNLEALEAQAEQSGADASASASADAGDGASAGARGRLLTDADIGADVDVEAGADAANDAGTPRAPGSADGHS